jgi:hypothetical protein
MSGWDPATGGSQDPPPPTPPPPARERSKRSPRSRARLWVGLGAGTALLVVVVVLAAVLVSAGSGVPPGTPDGVQLEQLLPPSAALPNGWYLVYTPSSSASFLQLGSAPPRPIDACTDFNQGFDLGAPGDTFVSSASETANYGAGAGDGFLRTDLYGVMPGGASATILAVSGWARRCSSYTVTGSFGGIHFSRHYTVTAAAAPGLGGQNLDVRATEQKPASAGPLFQVTDNNTLLVRAGNDLIVIECLGPPPSMITSLAGLATPMIRKLPSASTLPATAAGPRTAPVPSPGLTDAQLERLLPRTGLPAQFQTANSLSYSDATSGGGGAVPLARPPAALPCSQIPMLEDGGITQFDVNYLNVAYLEGDSPDSNGLDVVIDEPSRPPLADADFSALKAAAARCPRVRGNAAGLITTYKTVVTTVPGLGDENVNIRLDPLSANEWPGPQGPQDILLVRVADALVLVDWYYSLPGTSGPPAASIARPIVEKL